MASAGSRAPSRSGRRPQVWRRLALCALSLLAACGGFRQMFGDLAPWATPVDTQQYIYAIGSGRNGREAEQEMARALSNKLGVAVEGLTEKGWSWDQGTSAERHRTWAEKATRTWTSHVLYGLTVIKGPHKTEDGTVWVMGKCSRKNALAALIQEKVARMADSIGEGETVVVQPAALPSGESCLLGNLAAKLVADAINETDIDGCRVVDPNSPVAGAADKLVEGTVYPAESAGTATLHLSLIRTADRARVWGETLAIPTRGSRDMLADLALSTVPGFEAYMVGAAAPVRGGIRVEARLTSSQYVEGDEIQIRFRASEDGYAYLLDILMDGSVSRLVPNAVVRAFPVKAGQWFVFPDAEAKDAGIVALEAALMPNRNRVWEILKVVVVAKESDGLMKVPFAGEQSVAGTGYRLAELIDELDRLEKAGVRWGEARVAYEIAGAGEPLR